MTNHLVTLEMPDVSIYDRKGELRVRAGKGTRERIIPLNDTCRKALKAWYAVREAKDGEHVFTTQRGPATTRAIQSIIENVAGDAKVEGVTPHVIRHTFAKNLVNAGVSLEKVAMLLGHSSLDTTMIYTTPALSDLDKAVRAIE